MPTATADWKRIFCPIDFSDASRAAMELAADLARRFGAELTLLHAKATSSMLQAAQSEPGQLAEWQREAEGLGAPHVETSTVAGEPETAIVNAATAGGFDLVVMGTHGRTGRDHALIGSVAENVVRRSSVPVLTVHAAPA